MDHFIFSFHGLPEAQIKKVPGCLQSPDCCALAGACEKPCYRAQSYATAERIARAANLPKEKWTVSFQSRLGRAEWLKPSTDKALEDLARNGTRSVAVICPSFVADCIETLEEIGMGGKQLFLREGGTGFTMVPCVNADIRWIEGFAGMVKNQKLPEKSGSSSPSRQSL